MKFGIPLFVFLYLCFFVFLSEVQADSRKAVLGTMTSKKDLSAISMPATVEGPGIILPDSPLYFLDTIKQQARLLASFTPERRAKIHADVAGERLAELRFMLARNNKKGVQIALDGIAENYADASNNLSDAKMHGADVSKVSKMINDSVKAKMQTLDSLSQQMTGDLQQRIESINTSLFETKIHIEDNLGKADLDSEITDDVEWHISHQISQTTNVASIINAELEELKSQANEAGAKSLQSREKALHDAIVSKNKEKILAEEVKLKEEQALHDKEFQLHADAAESARQIIEKAKETEKKFRAIHQ